MRCFITGISGFVGAGLASRLLAEGAVSNLWRLKGMEDALRLHSGDLLDSASVQAALLSAKPDVLFHLGVYGAYPAQKDKSLILRTSFLSTVGLLDAAKEAKVGLVINTGSSSEYGTKNKPMREDDVLEPNSYYAVGKAAQTLYCRQFARDEKLPVITLRLFSVYGPYEERGRFMPTLISKALRNEDVPVSNPLNARDFIYLDDVSEAYVAVMKKPELSGEILNIGSGIQHTLRDAIDIVLKETGSTSRPLFGAEGGRGFDTSRWVANMEKTRAILNLTPARSLKEGLGDMIVWMRDNIHEY